MAAKGTSKEVATQTWKDITKNKNKNKNKDKLLRYFYDHFSFVMAIEKLVQPHTWLNGRKC